MEAAEEELTQECNYRQEASSQMKFRELVRGDPRLYVPRVYTELSSLRILTSEFVEGLPIDKVADYVREELEQGRTDNFPIDIRNDIASSLLHLALRELFEFRFMQVGHFTSCGVLHTCQQPATVLQTDPNWANFLYNPNTEMVNLIDFGAARGYSSSFMDKYLHMIHCCAERDRAGVLHYSTELGFLTGSESKATLDAHVESGFIVGEPFSMDGPYDFVAGQIPERVAAHTSAMLNGRLTPPPKEAYTLHRKLSGAFLSCKKLRAVIECRPMFMTYYNHYNA